MSGHASIVVCPQDRMEQVAAEMAKRHLCPGGGEDGCTACHLVDTGNHPDFLVVRRQYKASEKRQEHTIKVEQIRTLTAELAKKPYLSDRRFVAILEADTMPVGAQNALLKALEEPWPGCRFALLTENREKLLPTIQSRCERATAAGPQRADALEEEVQRAAEESLCLGFQREYSKMEERMAAFAKEPSLLLDAMLELTSRLLAGNAGLAVDVPDALQQAFSGDTADAAHIIQRLVSALSMAEVNVGKRQLYGWVVCGIREDMDEDGSRRKI